MTSTARLLSAALLALAGCGASTDPAPLDGGELDCTPRVIATGLLECPAGCVVITGLPLDDGRQCRLSTPTTLACHPPDAMVSGSGDIACFEREGAPHRVWSSSGSYVWTTPGGPTRLLFDEAGWTRCDPLEGWELPLAEPCDL